MDFGMRGIIDRRILVNYRVDPEPLQRLLPPPFRVKRVRGFGIAGICLIRLRQLRPSPVPSWLGLSFENGAHRIAVEWEEEGRLREGVYVERRDTSSCLAALAGGRIFPGEHHRARFRVREDDPRYRVAFESRDGKTRVSVDARRCGDLPAGSVFDTLAETSDFFRRGSLGWSPVGCTGGCEGLELQTETWKVEPLDVRDVRSSFFEDPDRFPPGSTAFDNALLMRDIPHSWHRLGTKTILDRPHSTP